MLIVLSTLAAGFYWWVLASSSFVIYHMCFFAVAMVIFLVKVLAKSYKVVSLSGDLARGTFGDARNQNDGNYWRRLKKVATKPSETY